MRYSPEHKQATRELILRAAARQFREKGFTETSVASIMKEANLTHGGFYAHFKSKDELVAEVINEGFDHVSDRFELTFDDLEGEAWLVMWVDRYLGDQHFMSRDQGCPLPSLTSEIARSGPQARESFTNLGYERLAKIITFVDAPEQEARRRVCAAFSQMVGAMMMARAMDEPFATDMRKAAKAEAIATLLGYVDVKAAEQRAAELVPDYGKEVEFSI